MKPTKKRKSKPHNSNPRFCDPEACHCCQYIGEGDFICDEHQTIVIADWEPTEDYMICERRNRSG